MILLASCKRQESRRLQCVVFVPFRILRSGFFIAKVFGLWGDDGQQPKVLPLIIANGLGDYQKPEIHVFSDREQWLELASGFDIIIGDSTFNISEALSDKIWINITDPSLYAGEEEINDK